MIMPKSVLVTAVLLAALLYPCAGLVAATPDAGMYAWSEEFAGKPLDLTGYALTFSDNFDEQTLTAESGEGPWRAPVHSDVGASTWDVPKPGNQTYAISKGVLKIRASRGKNGKWHAGNIQTVNGLGRGFAQSFGYFEARMKFPDMPGAWCAFWLKSQAEHWDRAMVRTEIDIVEWYGGDSTGHHHTVHLWPARQKQFRTPGHLGEHWWRSNFSRHEGLAGEWHTYGALITPELVRIYVDRKEVGRFPTLDEFRTPLYPLISLTLYEKDLDKAAPPFVLEVDRVNVYARR